MSNTKIDSKFIIATTKEIDAKMNEINDILIDVYSLLGDIRMEADQ